MDPAVDNSILLETSVGTCVIDTFGYDASDAVAWLKCACLAGALNGAIFSSMIFGGLIRVEFGFPLHDNDFRPLSSRYCTSHRGGMLRVTKGSGPAVQTGHKLRFSNRPGLVLMPMNEKVEQQEEQMLLAAKIRQHGSCAFYITATAQNFDYLENDFRAVGQLVEGQSVLSGLLTRFPNGNTHNSAPRWPLRLTRIKRAVLLLNVQGDDTLSRAAASLASRIAVEVAQLPQSSRSVVVDEHQVLRYNPAFHCDGLLSSDDESSSSHQVSKELHAKQVDQTRALMLNVLDGITDPTITPPDTVLFVCKLNPLTTSEGLRMCFSQFGAVKDASVTHDSKGNSRCYAFVEFETKASCDRAFAKMDKALIDDSRIHVDFSQSVSKIWAAAQGSRHRSRKSVREE